ncbi:MAG TPA: hypothetical protein VGJ15_13340 [Pirellulales bacterium]
MSRNDSSKRRLHIEPLERRQLLCGAAGTSALQAAAQSALLAGSHASSAVIARSISSHSSGSSSDSSETFLVTTLTNSSGVVEGTASFETDSNGNQKLVLSVVGATASTAYAVSVDGTTDLGTLTTDANGNGRLVLTAAGASTGTTSSALSAKCGGASTSTGTLPDGFTLAAGATVTLASATDTSVDPLNGTFATSTGDIGAGEGRGFGGGCHGEDNGATFSRLIASLTNSSSAAAGTAVFTTITHADGTAAEILRVRVTGADPSTSVDVSLTTTVDGTATTTPLGSIATDANGNGYLILSSNPKTSNVGQLPTGLTINSTSTISVGTTIGGTFNSTSSWGSSAFSLAGRFSFRRR